MKGHVRERPPGSGHWYAVIDTRDPSTGKRKRKWHSLDATGKRQAQIECAGIISAIKGGTYLEPNKTTVAQFMTRWLEHIKASVSPRTHERYKEIADKNIIPLLGHAPITKLKPIQVSEAYTKALASGRRDGKGGLSARTVHHIHRVLKQALAQAVRWQFLIRNPIDVVDSPKVERHRMTTYDMPQTVALLDAVRGTRMFIPAMLAVLCGLRRGEIAALRWRNVDLVNAQLAVVESAEQMNGRVRLKETKSGRTRTVAISATVVEELKKHRLQQAQDMLGLGVRWTDTGFVAALGDGSPMQPTFITHEWVRIISDTALPRIRFHDLRHAHATHMLSSGIHPKVASERLGHSKVGITLDLYSHVTPGMQEDAAAKMDAALKAAQRQH
jgi:integrase